MMKHEMMMNANMEVLENMFDEYIENGKIKLEGTNLVGETYKVKEYIKDFGGKWNKDVKGWNKPTKKKNIIFYKTHFEYTFKIA